MSAVVLIRVELAADAYGNHPRHRHPALDLKYIQAGIESSTGAAVPLIDQCLQPEAMAITIARILALQPRLAVIKASSASLAEAVACAQALHAAGIITIAIGQQVAHLARSDFPGWHEAFDLAVAGEPEEELPRLVARLLNGADIEALGRAYRQGWQAGVQFEVAEPDALPLPRYGPEELTAFAFPFPLRGLPSARWAYVLSSWGCPRACRHCSAVVRKSTGAKLRKRTPQKVADEITARLDQGAQAIAFEDDSLFVDRRHFLALCDALARRNLHFPWLANARPDELDDDRVAAARASGAVMLKVGVDAGAPRVIERIGKAPDGARWIEACSAGFERLHQARIGSVALFMVGLPDETEAEIRASMALARRLRPDYIQVQIYCAYPDTPLWADLPPEQRPDGALFHYGTGTSSSGAMAPAQLALWQQRFYREFYLRPTFIGAHGLRCWRHYLRPQTLGKTAAALAYLLRARLNLSPNAQSQPDGRAKAWR